MHGQTATVPPLTVGEIGVHHLSYLWPMTKIESRNAKIGNQLHAELLQMSYGGECRCDTSSPYAL